jgi:hypothetical protein
MNAKRVVGTAVRLALAGVAYMVCFALAFGLLVPAQPAPRAGVEPLSVGTAMLLVVALTTAVMGWLILRARPAGWALVGTLVPVLFGVQTFLPQIESLIFQAFPGFAQQLPVALVPRFVGAGLLHAVLWVPLAVWLLGHFRAGPADGTPQPPIVPGGWAVKVPLAALAYVAFYFTFGYYVAWSSPEVRAYYGGSDPGSYWLMLRNILRDTPWLPVAQVLRGLLWTGIALVVLRTIRGSLLEKALALGALFAVVMNAGLLLPNPYMPYAVRMAHLLETASSNFLYGLLLAWMFARPAVAARGAAAAPATAH